MHGPDYFRAMASEHGAIPALLLPGPGKEGVGILVRVFKTDLPGAVRITLETDVSVGQQVVVEAAALRDLLADPQSE